MGSLYALLVLCFSNFKDAIEEDFSFVRVLFVVGLPGPYGLA